MAAAQKLDSPIELPDHRLPVIPGTIFPSTPVPKDTRKHEFIKYGSPYDQLDRLFVGLGPSWRGIDAIEFKDGSPVQYINHCNLEGKETPINYLPKVSHPNLMVTKEIFVSKNRVHFCYDHWGITLDDIEDLWPDFQLTEAEVAMICKAVGPSSITKCEDLELTILKTLKGLRYLHNDLNICYGGLTGENVLITEGGDVKISKTQFSMMHGFI